MGDLAYWDGQVMVQGKQREVVNIGLGINQAGRRRNRATPLSLHTSSPYPARYVIHTFSHHAANLAVQGDTHGDLVPRL
jgi:hypothetical protein